MPNKQTYTLMFGAMVEGHGGRRSQAQLVSEEETTYVQGQMH